MNAKRLLGAALAVACVCVTLCVSAALAAETADPMRPTVDKLLKAIEANDQTAFLADATDTFKAALTKEVLEIVSKQFAPRLNKGYDCTYLGVLKQQGCQVHLWKLTFKDSGDDVLARLSMKDGKVAGFFLQ